MTEAGTHHELIKSRSLDYLRISQLIWRVTLLTLPLDIILAQSAFFGLSPLGDSARASYLPEALLLMALALSFKARLLRLITALQSVRRKVRLLSHEYPWLLPVLFAALVMLEGMIRTGLNLQGLLVGLISLTAIAVMLLRSRLRGRARSSPRIIFSSPAQALNEAEGIILLIVSGPPVLARLASLASSFMFAGPGFWGEAAPFLGAALLIIAANKPDLSDFFVLCPICSARSPRAAIDLGFCFACGKNILFKDRKTEMRAFLKDRKSSASTKATRGAEPAKSERTAPFFGKLFEKLRPKP